MSPVSAKVCNGVLPAFSVQYEAKRVDIWFEHTNPRRAAFISWFIADMIHAFFDGTLGEGRSFIR